MPANGSRPSEMPRNASSGTPNAWQARRIANVSMSTMSSATPS
jgi:hypothetical protein